MKITLNGKEKELASSLKLKEIITQFSQGTRPVIVEVNGNIIKNSQRDQIILKEGDTIELVGLVGGG